MRVRLSSGGGFGVLEVLVASTILLIGLSALAHVVIVAPLAARRARSLTLAAVFAQDKLETMVAQAAGGTLDASPADALSGNVEGYCDFLDATGRPLGGGTAAPWTAAYVRRWAIESVPAFAPGVLTLRVLVIDLRGSGVDARMVALVRQAP